MLQRVAQGARVPLHSTKRLFARSQIVAPVGIARPQMRRYTTPLVSKGVEKWQDDQTLEEKVRSIVHPDNYARIQQAFKVSEEAAREGRTMVRGREQERNQRWEQQSQAQESLAKLYEGVQEKTELNKENYAAFLEGFATLGDTNGCVKVLRDMRTRSVPIEDAQYTHVLSVASRQHDTLGIFAVEEEMNAADVAAKANSRTVFVNGVIASLCARGQVEYAYSMYTNMGDVVPMRAAIQVLVGSLCAIGEVDEAMEILRAAEGRGMALSQELYLQILHNAGRYMNEAAFRHSYRQLTTMFATQITEGDLLCGLDLAARAGDATLASGIVSRLKHSDYPLGEHHYEPILDALVRSAQWSSVFRILHMMRQGGFGAAAPTLRTLTRCLVVDKHDAETLVTHVFNALHEVRNDAPRACDAVTLNALIAALAYSGCVEAAAYRLDTWFTDLGVARTADSYAAVLRGCMLTRNKTIAEQMLARMLDVDGLTPSKEVLELMLHISLMQHNYEDAFVYLESMRNASMMPSWRTYASIVRRCARVNDPRAHTALREMKEHGHYVTHALREFVDASNRSAPGLAEDPEGEAIAEDPTGEGLLSGDHVAPKTSHLDLDKLLGSTMFKV
ncbi:hypothetical protein GGF46_000930 [Coemansia sp. RSA 552]|nr:hypothetical protein GGF46_000930 [Coemansia sp. RSA 552]